MQKTVSEKRQEKDKCEMFTKIQSILIMKFLFNKIITGFETNNQAKHGKIYLMRHAEGKRFRELFVRDATRLEKSTIFIAIHVLKVSRFRDDERKWKSTFARAKKSCGTYIPTYARAAYPQVLRNSIDGCEASGFPLASQWFSSTNFFLSSSRLRPSPRIAARYL